MLILITECGWPVWCAGGRPTALLIIIRNVILCTQSLVTTLTLRSAAAGISPWARAQHSRLVTSSDSDLSLLQILTREGSLQLAPGAAAWPDSAATGERDWGRVATARCAGPGPHTRAPALQNYTAVITSESGETSSLW